MFTYNNVELRSPFITVNRADEPLEVLWKSLDATPAVQMTRAVISWLIVCLTIFVLFLLSLAAGRGGFRGITGFVLPLIVLALNKIGPYLYVPNHRFF